MIQDLHSHTYYSFCGKDRPEEIVEAAIAGGVELFGICDHNYGIGYAQKSVYDLPREVMQESYGRNLIHYLDHMRLIRENTPIAFGSFAASRWRPTTTNGRRSPPAWIFPCLTIA